MISQLSHEQQFKVGKFDLGMSARWLEARVRHTTRQGALSPRESVLAERIKLLKREAGSHSPSAPTLARMIPELRLRVDACFARIHAKCLAGSSPLTGMTGAPARRMLRPGHRSFLPREESR